MRLIRFLSVLTIYAVAFTSAASAQDAPPSNSGDISWNEAPPGGPAAQRKTLEFARIVMQIPQQESIGTTFTDLSCAFNGTPIYVTRSGDWVASEFAPLFDQELARAGFGAAPVNADSLFENMATRGKADLLVAAAITALNVRACTGAQSGILAGAGAKSTAKITVSWQVLDPLEKKIIFRGTSEGNGRVSSDPRTSVMMATRAAFGEAARNIIATPDFQRITTVSTADQEKIAQLSQTPATLTRIAATPLSSRVFKEGVKETQAHVVTVRSGSGHGSGFYIADGLLLTNHHVAVKGATVKIRFLSGKEIAGLVISSDAARDVALIRTENVDLAGLPIQVQTPAIGDQVFVIGSPAGEDMEGTVSAGIVSSMRTFEQKLFIQSDVMVTHGNSGGPMFDAQGNVVGITVIGLHLNTVQGLNLFIPIGEAIASVGVVIDPPEPAKATKVSAKKKAAQ